MSRGHAVHETEPAHTWRACVSLAAASVCQSDSVSPPGQVTVLAGEERACTWTLWLSHKPVPADLPTGPTAF